MDVTHVRLTVKGRTTCNLRRCNTINQCLDVLDTWFPGHSARQLLAQVRLSTRPVKNSIQRCSSIVMIAV